MKEIILPIKCSTVRRIQDVILPIIVCELFVLSFAFFAYGVWSLWVMFYYYPVAQIIVNPLFASIGLVTPVMWYFGIKDHLPEISCIKDDEHPDTMPQYKRT